ncbi:asparaginase [Croceivirga thetidis]|uniref:Asparaginase n=1 Tax=Croceivirga thetidis TaxID=2721623 RepID=A0ABX1GLD7_9FLAO|nr:asparaginase [Croceivirga thetidis]NKI30688.1 asparaginase [Croceivirga thetidis]
MERSTKILLIYTGGTIGMVKDYETGALTAFNFDTLLSNIPELVQLDCEIESVSFNVPIDSSNMNPGYWVKIADFIGDNYETHDGFVVLHGSDTMSYSASALSFMLEGLRKPVIFTGSQLPIGDLRTDAKENLITAIQLAALREMEEPAIQEVGLYFEYKLYRGNRTTKVNAEHFEAFNSPNYPELVNSGVHLNINLPYLRKVKNTKRTLKIHKNLDRNVGILKIFPGIDKTFVESILKIDGLKALVLETFGAGNATTENWFVEALSNAINKGLHVINVTQCIGGGVVMGHYETSKELQRIGVINGKEITTEAAITKAMYLLGQQVGHMAFKTIFETSLRGEMS